MDTKNPNIYTSNMKHFYMARHGLTDWNMVPKVQGSTDIPLNDEGIRQANKLAENILSSGVKIDKILYSPLSRATVTAKIVSEKCSIPMEEEPRLIEQNFGKWEGWAFRIDNSFTEAKKRFADSYEGGESMFHLAQRIYNFLDELKNKPSDETYLLITHGGIARVVQSYFTDMTNDEFANFSLKNCEIREYIF